MWRSGKKDKKKSSSDKKDKKSISGSSEGESSTRSNTVSRPAAGTAAPPVAATPAVAVPQEPQDENLVFTGDQRDGRPVVKGGSIEKLVERLTYEKYADPHYLQAFMLTYRSFATPLELMKLLRNRYNIQPTGKVSDKQKAEFEQSVQRPVRLRVYNCLKHWIQKGFYDFMDDEQLTNELTDFIKNTMMKTGMENPAKQLQKMFDRQASGEDRDKKLMFSSTPPVPHLPMNVGDRELGLLDFHPEELARQLTLIEYELFKSIKPWECLNQAWAKKDKETRAPNILAMITRFNHVSNWVATEIVSIENLKQRAKVLQFVIEMAEYCKSLNNFNAMMEIISGLQNSAVYRLKATWAQLPGKYQRSYSDMHQIMSRDQNYKNARAYLHNVDPPCIPYLGVYLTDLTFIEDGNKDHLPGERQLINFVKRQQISQVIAEIQQYQNTPYCLEQVSFIRDYVFTLNFLDENTCYKMSLEREDKGGVTAKKPGRRETRATISEEPADTANPYGTIETIEGYPFGLPDNDNNIILVKDTDSPLSPIKGGTTIKLVERVTYDKYPDMNYMLAFLMSYRTFMTADELMDLLHKRFNMPQPKNPTKAQAAKFKQERVLPIHLRIFNVLKFWVDKYGVDFTEDKALAQRLIDFVDMAVKSNNVLAKPAEQIRKMTEKRQSDTITIPTFTFLGDKGGESKTTETVVDFDSEQIAHGIISLDQDIFRNIDGRECLCTNFESPEASLVAPSIIALRTNFDRTKRWALSEIIRASGAEGRAKVLSHLVRICETLYSMKAFNPLVAIIQALVHSKWLAPLWDWVPSQLVQSYTQITNLVKHPKKLREKEKSEDITTPTLPYLELYLRQLSAVADMLPETLNNGLINFEKRRKMYDVYSSWHTYQQHPFEFDICPEVDEYLANVKILETEEIKAQSASVQATPPASRPNLDFVPNPARRAAVSRVTTSAVDDGGLGDGRTSPRGFASIDESLSTQLKSIVLNVMSEEGDTVRKLVDEAKKELQGDLLQDLQDFTASVHDEMIIMNGQYGLADAEQVRAAGKRIVSRKFPGHDIRDWTALDTQGVVYGWQEEIFLHMIDDNEGSKFLVHVAPHMDGPGLGAFLRMIDLHGSVTGSPAHEAGFTLVVISASVAESAEEAANEQGIQLMSF